MSDYLGIPRRSKIEARVRWRFGPAVCGVDLFFARKDDFASFWAGLSISYHELGISI